MVKRGGKIPIAHNKDGVTKATSYSARGEKHMAKGEKSGKNRASGDGGGGGRRDGPQNLGLWGNHVSGGSYYVNKGTDIKGFGREKKKTTYGAPHWRDI